MNKDIFLQPFSGTIEELQTHCNSRADDVLKVVEEGDNLHLTYDETVDFLLAESDYALSIEQAKDLAHAVIAEWLKDEYLEPMVAKGLVAKTWDGKYEITEEGKKYV